MLHGGEQRAIGAARAASAPAGGILLRAGSALISGSSQIYACCCSRRARAPTISCRWRPSPPPPNGAGQETTTSPPGRAASWSCKACARLSDPNPSAVRTAAGVRSVELVIAPQRHQIALQVLAGRDHLGLEAAAQLGHELVVWRSRISIHDPALYRVQPTLALLSGGQPLNRRLQRPRHRPAAVVEDLHNLVEAPRAHPAVGPAGLDQLHGPAVVHVEEAQDLAHRPLIVGTEVVVDQHQDLLAWEDRVV